MPERPNGHAWKACNLARGSRVRPATRAGRPAFMAGRIPRDREMTFVYLLFLSNGDIYKGLTDNFERRFEEHRFGKVKSTRNFLPVRLIGYEAYLTKSDALRREQFLKKSQGMKLLRQQYRDILIQLAEQSSV